MSLWESVKDTAKSLGGAVAAPYGAVWDLATAPFDGEDDDFGSLVNKVSGRGADILDPILNDKTVSGYAFTKTMQGLEWAYREGVSEPLVTANTTYGHAVTTGNFEDIFSGRTWGDAYDVAQNRSIGQSLTLNNPFTGSHEFGTDPMDERAYKQFHENAPFLSSLESGTYDFAARWYLDPGVVLGKAAMAARAAKATREIKPSDFQGGEILPRLFEQKHGVKPFDVFRKDSLATRTEDYLRYVNTGAQGKPLNGAQIYVATPELKRAAAGRQIAGLLADAGKIEDEAVRGLAQRKILAVAWGDVAEIGRSKEELAQMGAVGDALKNIGKGNVVDLKAHALGGAITSNPVLMASMQSQLDNLDDVTRVVDLHVRKLENLMDVEDSLKYAPGVRAQGKRALAREEGRGLTRSGEAASGHATFDKPANWVLERATRLAKHPAISSVYQRSSSHMPLKVITHTPMSVAKWNLQAPGKFSDAMRTSHLQGFVSTHDWNGATNQLDSMLKLGNVDPGQRMELLSKVQMARTETEKVTLIHQVEKATVRGLIAKHGVNKDFGSHKELQDFIETVMDKGQAGRSSHLAALNGRAYAATKNATDEGGDRVDQIRPRANLIDEQDGVPVALPLLETQGRNYVPLFDAQLADKTLGREYGRLMSHARMWQKGNYEINRLKQLQATTGKNVEKALSGWYQAMDHAVDAASFTMRVWKFSVLFRLGYPLRVISDDHMRIWSQMGAAAIMAPVARESLGNVWYNQSTRYREVAKEAHKARVRLAELRGQMSDEFIAAYADRAAQVTSLNRRIASGEWALKRLQDKPVEVPAGRFHGTRRRFENDHPSDIWSAGSSANNLYGPGLYTTDNFDIATSYRRKGGATPDEVVYQTKWTGDAEPNLLDLDQPLNPTVARWAEQQLANVDKAYLDATEEAYDELRALIDRGATSGDVIRGVRRMMASTGEVPKAQADENVDMLAELLMDEGFNGLSHVGGNVMGQGKVNHGVHIYFDTDKVKLSVVADPRAVAQERIRERAERLERLKGERDTLQQAMGDSPDDLLREQEALQNFLDLSRREQAKIKRKRRRGDKERVMADGTRYDGAFGGDQGDAYRVASSSNATFDNLAKVGEERLFKDTAGEGSWQIIHNDNPTHHVAWADALNNQFRQSKVAMFFVKNDDATVDDFVRWIREPDQRSLRERLPHFAHDPEDWGWRVKQLVDDYLPSGELRQNVAKGRVTPRQLDKMFADKSALPSVHGATVANNLGMSKFATTAGQTMNRLYKMIGETPTDRLSRHPYFAALYDAEVARLHQRRKAFADAKGKQFTQADVDDVTRIARKNALNDVRRTLFDIAAHSNAAHLMRFVSPFFAAHQEALTRWWRIVGDDPSIIRRFQQGFDMPRKLGLVVDSETGEPVESGEMPGPGHAILFQMPEAWGGPSLDPNDPDFKMTDWRVNENSFNLILQNGIMNPGVGPIVQVPVETMVQKYAQYEDIERVARLINPYPPQSLGSMMLPATVRRVHTLIQQEKSSEFARMMAVNLQDKIVDWKLAHGDREPTQLELRRITEDAKQETVTEAWLRLGQNALSPAPASPRSKYEVFRQGWRKINDQAEAQGRDYDWRIEQFRQKYGEAYLPMIASSSNNVGNVDATNETVGALKRHKRLIGRVDPRLAGAIVGSAGAYQSAEDYSSTAQKWLRENRPTPGDSGAFMSYDDPLKAAEEAAVKRGWNKYGRAMDTLTAMAVEAGLQHYSQSDQLMQLKRLVVANLSEENHYWGEDYTDFNPGEYDSFLDDLNIIASDRGTKDRGDVKVLQKYLAVRQMFTNELARRKTVGLSGSPEAQSNRELMSKFQDIVAALTESNLDFEEYFYNGMVERDPYLRQVFN